MDVQLRTRAADGMLGAGAFAVLAAATGMIVTVGTGAAPGLTWTVMLLAGLTLALPGVFSRVDRRGDLSSDTALQYLHRARQHGSEHPAQLVGSD